MIQTDGKRTIAQHPGTTQDAPDLQAIVLDGLSTPRGLTVTGDPKQDAANMRKVARLADTIADALDPDHGPGEAHPGVPHRV
jgi:hypothetical protein